MQSGRTTGKERAIQFQHSACIKSNRQLDVQPPFFIGLYRRRYASRRHTICIQPDRVVARDIEYGVTTRHAQIDVIASTALQNVISAIADQRVVPSPTQQHIIAGSTIEPPSFVPQLQRKRREKLFRHQRLDIEHLTVRKLDRAGARRKEGAVQIERAAVIQRNIQLHIGIAVVPRYGGSSKPTRTQPGRRRQNDRVVALDVENSVSTGDGQIGVVARAAFQDVVAFAAVQHIVAVAADQPIVSGAPEQHVFAFIAFQNIIAFTAVEDVVVLTPAQLIVPGSAQQSVAARSSPDHIVAIPPVDVIVAIVFGRIDPPVAHENVVARLPQNNVRTLTTKHDVVIRTGIDDVVALATFDPVVSRAAIDHVRAANRSQCGSAVLDVGVVGGIAALLDDLPGQRPVDIGIALLVAVDVVVAAAADQEVFAFSTQQDVVAGAAHQCVDPIVAGEPVAPPAAGLGFAGEDGGTKVGDGVDGEEVVVTHPTDQDVAVGTAGQDVVAGAAGEGVLSGTAFEEVVSATPGVKGVVAAVAEDVVVAIAVVEGVFPVGGGFAADDDVAEAVVVFLDACGFRVVVEGLEVACDGVGGGRGGDGGRLGASAQVDAEVAGGPTFDFDLGAVEAGDDEGLAAVR